MLEKKVGKFRYTEFKPGNNKDSNILNGLYLSSYKIKKIIVHSKENRQR